MPSQTQDSIRPATSADIPLILQRLSELPNPPYQEDVQALLDDEWESIFVNDESGEVARVALSEQPKEGCLVWLLPLLPKRFPELRELARAAERDALAKHPEVADWRYYATFQWQRKDGSVLLKDKGRKIAHHARDHYYPGAFVKMRKRPGAVDDGVWEMATTLGVAAR